MFFKKTQKKNINKIDTLVKKAVVKNQCQVDAKKLKRLTKEDSVIDQELVVSLTTYSKRIHDVYLVLETICQQTVLPNRVILWLAEDEFDNNNLPISIKERMEFGLEVRFCDDIKSYKKIIPTIENFPNSVIITLDDDVLYPADTIELLVNEHKKNPTSIIGNRAHEITYKKGKVMAYKKWIKETKNNSDNIFLTGCGAILYPPNSLHKDVVKKEIFTEICPYADDVWLFFMAKLNKTKIINAEGRDFREFVELSDGYSEGLNKLNVDRGYNDKQIANVMDYYKINL
ncbi:hypothetical protein [Halomonas sp. HL-93]|uniref:hypothetical protein n=1 Tax=Halomonas sp. HL-93 TaxID=1666906 RepID=UPI0007F0B308|nr:hypothetical protein [Halomonas sp. HL-93]SBR52488.1 Glycosyl transferase family 64 domain-containing protein [Halomonas sp. HL-93]